MTDMHATTGARALAEARSWLGTPYRHQGTRKQVGCDCLGLVRGIWRALYAVPEPPVPVYSADWAESAADDALLAAARRHCVELDGLADARPGDLLLFRWRHGCVSKHLGILNDKDHLIHAYAGAGVVCSALAPWRRRVCGVFRFRDPD